MLTRDARPLAPCIELRRESPLARAGRPRDGSLSPRADRPGLFLVRACFARCHRRFNDGDVLLRRSAADSDARDHSLLAGQVCDSRQLERDRKAGLTGAAFAP